MLITWENVIPMISMTPRQSLLVTGKHLEVKTAFPIRFFKHAKPLIWTSNSLRKHVDLIRVCFHTQKNIKKSKNNINLYYLPVILQMLRDLLDGRPRSPTHKGRLFPTAAFSRNKVEQEKLSWWMNSKNWISDTRSSLHQTYVKENCICGQRRRNLIYARNKYSFFNLSKTLVKEWQRWPTDQLWTNYGRPIIFSASLKLKNPIVSQDTPYIPAAPVKN